MDGLLLKIEPKSDVDPGAVVIGVNRNHPGSWGDDHTSAHGCVHRDISAVIGPIRVFDCFSVTLSVAPVVSLPSFMGVVMVIVIAMGLSGGAATDASDSNQKRSNAETLGERHG